MIDKGLAKSTLEEFLSLPISSSKVVLDMFASLPNAISHYDGKKRNFVYVPGTREDRTILAAHADTFWDNEYCELNAKQAIKLENGVYSGTNSEFGIGADDRAGCAMLWLLKDSGHSLLVLDGEEYGQIGSEHIRDSYKELYNEINDHSYIIQLDRRGSIDYKVYKLPVTTEFLQFIESNTGYINAGTKAFTDIVALCERVCGVNLSVGYYNEHTSDEILVFDEWYNTLSVVEKLIEDKQKRFPLATHK